MSHTFKSNRARFHFNSDGSGDVDIVSDAAGKVHSCDCVNCGSVSVPVADVLSFVAEMARRQVEAPGVYPPKGGLDALTDDERLDLFRLYCRFCGSKSQRCTCTKDE